MRAPSLVAALVLLVCAGGCRRDEPATATPGPDPAATTIAAPCDQEIYRSFDFWLGSWEVSGANDQVAGHNRIERAHGGCAVIEHWQSVRGNSGTSTNYYDPGKRLWVQNWIDASGSVIQLEGGLDASGSMVLEGRYVIPTGVETTMRGTWTLLDDGRVRQLFEVTNDGGETWSTWFEGLYARE